MKNHRNTGIFRERSEELFKMLIFERVQIFKMVDDWWEISIGKMCFQSDQCWFVRGEGPKDALSPITYASTMLFEGFPQAHASIHSAMH